MSGTGGIAVVDGPAIGIKGSQSRLPADGADVVICRQKLGVGHAGVGISSTCIVFIMLHDGICVNAVCQPNGHRESVSIGIGAGGFRATDAHQKYGLKFSPALYIVSGRRACRPGC